MACFARLRAGVHAFKLQASNILNEAYTKHLRRALEAKKKKRDKKSGIKLIGDGLPKMLSGDKFYELAQAKEKEVWEFARQKEARKDDWVAYDAAVEVWVVEDQEHRGKCETIKANNKRAKAAWERRKAAALKKNKKFTKSKPKPVLLPKVIPKPRLKDFLDGGNGGVDAGNVGDDAGDGSNEEESNGSTSDNDDE
ncbi:hypothetical protein GALMADRAFT_148409 [Galerina marginata CBS 339.88]|uniref:Uncharacterized protein n=1 Tax=Galerina marginata (strain CBS 339.88) TaxID=685588 RepID=A0A067S785_GALM3|nr:hypothetical protein GALMADRAFT_148409 [Galerina marginata CBS 339.88]